MPKQHFFVNEDELDDFQLQLLQKRIDRSMVVSGCAGSGKSILALWKAKHIQDAGYSYKFIVFTKALHKFMSDGIKNIGLNDSNFTYHHEWCNRQGCPSADFIIVDEVQDFEHVDISQFKQAANKAFFFWGDSSQSLYRGFRDTQNILSIAAEASIQPETLVFNYRLPKKIARFAAQVNGDEDLVQRCRKNDTEDMPLPRILRYSTFEEQLDVAMQQIKNRQITDAALLFHDNQRVQKAYSYLKSKGYTIEANYRDRQDFRNDMADLHFDSANPKLMTYHSAKGLQFEAVFLPLCEAEFELSDKTMNPTSLFVAITRSYGHLFVMYSNKLVRFFDNVPKNLYSTTLEEEKYAL